MLRFLLPLALAFLMTAPASAKDAPVRYRLSIGPAFWFNLDPSSCKGPSIPRDDDNPGPPLIANIEEATCEDSNLWYGGANASFDLEALRWLRVGAQLGFGGHVHSTWGRREQLNVDRRAWLVPIGVHAHAHLEPNRRVSLWLGPELFYSLRLDRAETDLRTGSGGVEDPLEVVHQSERATRSGMMVGISLGFDVHLGGRLSLGSDLGLDASYTQEGRALWTLTGGWGAVLRTALLLRFLL